MGRSKVIPMAAAAALLDDGSSVGIGGVLLRRKPMAFLTELLRADRRRLRLYSFLCSLDVDLLVAGGAVAEVHAGYVGFEQLGFAPAYSAALAAGAIRAYEYSEFVFMAGLRASLAGLPFLPTRGSMGSELVDELELREVACPYTGERLLAAPALRPDVGVIHAVGADEHGNVLAPAQDMLWDFDAAIARASERAIVTAERILSTEEIRRNRALVFSFEVEAVVEAPRGAWPTAVAGVYGADVDAVREYLAAAASDPAAAAERLAGVAP